MKSLVRALATLGPIGFAPIAPATAGSAVVALVGYFLPPMSPAVAIGLIVLATPLAAWIAGEAETFYGHDAKPIVIDELIGQSLALMFVPKHVAAYLAAFLLFRLFDIWKPLGAREAQRLRGGIGVVADDVIAGLTACAAVHVLLAVAHRVGVTL
jgi:phosphatidylglycerophosphatase A